MRKRMLIWPCLVLLLAPTLHGQDKRDLLVRKDKQQVEADEAWFYDDLDRAMEAAAKTKRPLMIVFR